MRRSTLGLIIIGSLAIAAGACIPWIFWTWEDKYNNLLEKYHDLHDDYNDLSQDYDDLLDDYNTLFSNYNDLFGQYQSILSILEDPLTDPVLPTVEEVLTWLDSDDTDTYIWVEGIWECGDFSAMLMVRAKEMNWRMRIACMFYSHAGESGWQSTDGYDQYGEHGHAFNLILTQDSDDVGSEPDVHYIEPQTDLMWYLSWASWGVSHYRIYYTYTGGLTGQLFGTNYWVNHYSFFG